MIISILHSVNHFAYRIVEFSGMIIILSVVSIIICLMSAFSARL